MMENEPQLKGFGRYTLQFLSGLTMIFSVFLLILFVVLRVLADYLLGPKSVLLKDNAFLVVCAVVVVSVTAIYLFFEALLAKSKGQTFLAACKNSFGKALKWYLVSLSIGCAILGIFVAMTFGDLRYCMSARRAAYSIEGKEYEKAVGQLQELETVSTTPFRVYTAITLKGYCLIESGKYEEAEKVLTETIKHLSEAKPQDRVLLATAQYMLGAGYQKQKRTSDTETSWEASLATIKDAEKENQLTSSDIIFGIKSDVRLPPVHARLAQVYFDDGKFADAQRICKDFFDDPKQTNEEEKKTLTRLQEQLKSKQGK